MKGLEVRMARALNKVMGRKGPVFADRYHAHLLASPRQAANAVRYVLENWKVHAAREGQPAPPASTHSAPRPLWPAGRRWLRSRSGGCCVSASRSSANARERRERRRQDNPSVAALERAGHKIRGGPHRGCGAPPPHPSPKRKRVLGWRLERAVCGRVSILFPLMKPSLALVPALMIRAV